MAKGRCVDDEWVLLVSGAMSRRHADDSRIFLRELATLLERAAPDETSVVRKGVFGGDNRPVKRLEYVDGDDRYVLSDPGRGDLWATKSEIVGGISIKTRPIGVDEWIAGVVGAVERRERRRKEIRDALAHWTLGTALTDDDR